MQEDFTKHQEGSWRAKSLIQDLKKNKSFVVYMDINSIRPDRLRMDVETSLGIHVATMSYDRDQVQIIVPNQKRFYQGKVSDTALKKVIPINVNPKWLVDILFEQAPSGKDWKCNRDKASKLTDCTNGEINIQWLKRERQMRVVAFESKDAKIQLQLKGFEPEAKQAEFYTLKKPAGFRQIELR